MKTNKKMNEETASSVMVKCPLCGSDKTKYEVSGYKKGVKCKECGILIPVNEKQNPLGLKGRSMLPCHPERRPMDRLSCGTCKHFRDVGYQHWGECTAPAPRWAWGEYIETTRQVFRDGSAADLAPDCEAYKPNPRVDGAADEQAKKEQGT